MTYAELRDANAHNWRIEHGYRAFGLFFVPSWGDDLLRAATFRNTTCETLFQQAHDAGMQAAAAQNEVDWTHLYGVAHPHGVTHLNGAGPIAGAATVPVKADGTDVLAVILIAVMNALCPATAGFDAILEPIVKTILAALLSSLSTASTALASPADFGATIRQWATEAGQGPFEATQSFVAAKVPEDTKI